MKLETRWTPEEDDILRASYSRMATEKIAAMLQRTISGVRKRALRLKLTTPLNKKPWTEEELKYLKDMYPKLNGKTFLLTDLAELMNRTVSSIQHQAGRSNLCDEVERTEWTEAEAQILRDSYWKTSIDDLAQQLKRTESSVQHKLSRLGISDGHLHFELSKSLKNALDGLLLGDGNYKKNSEYSASFRLGQRATQKDWIDSLGALFEQNKVYTTVNTIDAHQRTTKSGVIINSSEHLYLYTASYSTLLPEYYRWYPQGIKIVPRDIDIADPELLAHWYMGDGSTYVDKNGYMTGELCTNSFSEEDVNWLMDEFLTKLNIKTSVKKIRKKEFGIRMYNSELDKLFTLIRNRVTKSFEYKVPFNTRIPSKCFICGVQLGKGTDGYKYCKEHQTKRAK